MSRTVNPNVQTEIVKQSVQAFHICELTLPTSGAVHLSEGPQVSYAADTYLEGSLKVGTLSWAETGVQKAQITLQDDGTGDMIALALDNQLADSPAVLYLMYRTSSGGDTTPVKLVTGTLNPISITDNEVKLEILAVRASDSTYPDKYCTKDNGFNWLPKEGQIVEWGDEKFELVTD